MKSTKVKFLILLLLIIGIAGSILFFPVNIKNRHTCLGHKLMNNQQQELNKLDSDQNSMIHHTITSGHEGHQSLLLQRYVYPFGIFWWLSLGTVFGVIYLLFYRRNSNYTNKHKIIQK
jgi:hypothetical protein